ncbi:hypothetical protein ACMYSQ_002199 [Aspergillus niger]
MATWQVHLDQSQSSDNELQEDSNPEARFKGSTSFGKSGSPVDWFPLPPVQRPHSEQPSIQSNPNPVHAFRSISFPFTHPVFLSDRIDWHGRPVGHNGRSVTARKTLDF